MYKCYSAVRRITCIQYFIIEQKRHLYLKRVDAKYCSGIEYLIATRTKSMQCNTKQCLLAASIHSNVTLLYLQQLRIMKQCMLIQFHALPLNSILLQNISQRRPETLQSVHWMQLLIYNSLELQCIQYTSLNKSTPAYNTIPTVTENRCR